MEIIEADNDYLVIDFDNKVIKGKTTKKGFTGQIKALKGVIDET